MDDSRGQATLNKTDQNIGAVISLLAVALLFTYLSFSFIKLDNGVTILSAIGIALLSATCLCLLLLRKFRRADEPRLIDYLNIGTQRYILAILMVLYGIDKLLGNFFDYQLFALDSKLADVSEFELAWFFYGKSRWQELFTGILEFIPGLLLLHRRTYYIAAMILLPVTAQVFFLNLFFKIGGITLPVSAILLACNLYIIYSQKEQIVRFFKSLNAHPAGALTGKIKTVIKIIRYAGFVLLCLVVFLKVRPAIFRSPYRRAYQRLIGAYSFKEMKKNGNRYVPAGDSLYYKDLYIEKQERWNILRRFNNETAAFILSINSRNDSMAVYINKGGIGDEVDIIDSVTVLKGVYSLDGKNLRIKGVQMTDTLELLYEKQERLKPKQWFW